MIYRTVGLTREAWLALSEARLAQAQTMHDPADVPTLSELASRAILAAYSPRPDFPRPDSSGQNGATEG